MTRVKRLRMVLSVAGLVAGLVFIGWTTTISVEAISCEEAWNNYLVADATYEIARQSYFYGIPTTCAAECAASQNIPQCISDCETSRYTNLGNASIALFGLALDTCIPYQYDQCESARAIANGCLSQYDPSCYSDPEEASAVADQRAACREASKVDYCQ